MKFGKEYFDGARIYGYGGYRYDGRWIKIAKSIIKRYKLKKGDKVLDIGCAKGFLMFELKKREHYVKPSEKRRMKKAAAIIRQKKTQTKKGMNKGNYRK